MKGAVKGSEALSIASSIATLTGVSFTWLATKGGFENAGMVEIGFKSVSAAIGILLSIGILFLTVRAFSAGYEKAKPENHVFCWTFGLALSVFVASIPIAIIYGCAAFIWSIHY
ncbi:hypothetical protein ACTJK9_22675 [Pseudomonas sp. 22082]|uniref:hypothetical protein n=1 Tax=Pseudomonas sp. 22082 TaxID=3453868 RepID=UPI003F87B568